MEINTRANTNHGPDTILRFQIAVSTVCMICCVLSIVTRTYTRRVILKTFNLEDCMAASLTIYLSDYN